MIRDVLTIDGHIIFDQHNVFMSVELNPNHPLAVPVSAAFPYRYDPNVPYFAQN